MGKKSLIKHIFKNKFPGSFSESAPDDVHQVHITDALSYMWDMFMNSKDASGNTASMKTSDHFVLKMRELAVAPLLDSRACNTHVVLFDKSDYTHITKGIEMPSECYNETPTMKRDREDEENLNGRMKWVEKTFNEEKKAGTAAYSFPNMFEGHATFLPTPWSGVMKSRDTVRRWMISCAIMGMVDVDNAQYAINHGAEGSMHLKKVIFDGHCMEPSDLIYLKGFDMMASFGLECDTRETRNEDFPCGGCKACLDALGRYIYDTPIVLHFDGEYRRRIYLDSSLRNQIGEADFTIYHYIRKLQCADEQGAPQCTNFMVHSIDADILVLGLINSCKLRGGVKVHINTGFWRKLSTADKIQRDTWGRTVSHTSPYARVQSLYVDMESLCEEIAEEIMVNHCSSKFKPTFMQIILDLTCALYSAGSDYTYGIDGVTTEAFYDAFCENYSDIGIMVSVLPNDTPVVGADCAHDPKGKKRNAENATPHKSMVFDAGAYCRMIKYAYISTKRMLKVCHDTEPSNSGLGDITELGASMYPDKMENQFPSLTRLFCMALNMAYYAEMLVQVGESVITLPAEGDLFLFGFGNMLDFSTMAPIPGKLSRGKIRMLCTDDIVIRKAEVVTNKRIKKMQKDAAQKKKA